MTTTGRRWSLLALVAVMSITACSGGDDAIDDAIDDATTTLDSTASTTASTEPADAPASNTTESTATATAPSEDDETNDDTTNDDASEATTTTIAVPLIDGVDVSIELLTPVAGSGIRPRLEWSPVDGASRYMVVVYAPDGAPYWTWTTADTAVHVSGEPVLDDERPGPSVIDGMSWGVVALDDAIVPVAYSARRPIAP